MSSTNSNKNSDNPSNSKLNNNITLTVKYKESNLSKGTETRKVCSYYSFITNKWETNGCTLIKWTQYNFTCSCTHLTDFAINTQDI